MKRKNAIILLVVALIVAYVYLNRNARREGLEEEKEQKVPEPSKVPIGPTENNPEPIAPA